MKIFYIVLAVLVGIAAILFLIGYLIARSIFRAAPNRVYKDPDDRIFDHNVELIRNTEFENPKLYKKLHIVADDGITLFAHYLKAEQQTHKYMILFHGYHGKRFFTSNLIAKVHENGFNVVIVDERGHGESEGKYLTMGKLEAQDGIKWIDHICDLDPKAQICIHGHSMGGHITMLLAGSNLRSNVKCAIEDCGYVKLSDLILYIGRDFYKAPLAKFFTKITMLVAKIVYKVEDTDVRDGLSKSFIPICFIHGDSDNYVPVENVEIAYDSAKKCEKEKYIFKGAMHCSSESNDPQRYYNIFLTFMNKYIK